MKKHSTVKYLTEEKFDRALKTLATKDDLTRNVQVIINTIDGFMKRLDTQEARTWTNVQRWKDLEPQVENHEHRLNALEGKKPGF